MVVGPDHRLLLPASAVFGAILLVLADILARTLVAPAEIPIGIITAILGGPFFLWLLIRYRRKLAL
jgi:iron complex transport system permease protein